MTRDGLVEENLTDGIHKKVQSKEMPRIRGSDQQRFSSSKVIDERENIQKDSDMSEQKSAIKKKQMKLRITKEQAKSGGLSFDDVDNQMVKGSGMGIVRKTADISTTTVSNSMGDNNSEEEENATSDELHTGRVAGEMMVRGLRRAQLRSKRTDVKAHRRGFRTEEMPEKSPEVWVE